MSIWNHIGAGIAISDQTIKITRPTLFNMAMAITGNSDDLRHYLQYLLIDPALNTLTASNGFSLISTPEALDFSGYQKTKKILIKPESALPKDCTTAVICFKEKIIYAYRLKLPFLKIPFDVLDFKYPDFSGILASINESTRIPMDSIDLSPKLLRKMHKASGSYAVSIVPHQGLKGIVYSIRFSDVRDEYTAILMPVNI